MAVQQQEKVLAFAQIVPEEGNTGRFEVYFPELPGAFSMGNSFSDAVFNAAECATAHLAGGIPRDAALSNSLEAFHDAFPNLQGTIVPVSVPILEPNARKAYNIRLPKGLMTKVDDLAQRQGSSRSHLIELAARKLLAEAGEV